MSTEMCVLLLWLVLIQEGAAIRPVVTFTPDYKKIFTSEQITMTCDVGSTIGEEMDYIWYKDSKQVSNGKSYIIQKAETSHSGSYQCQTRPGEISDPARLDVSNGVVILQTPLYVYEGDEIYIRCHHYPGKSVGLTMFYKDKRVIRGWTENEEFCIRNVDRTTAGTYKCTKQVDYLILLSSQYDDEVSVSIEDLFTTPTISVTPQPVITTDKMTLTCQTSLHPPRHNTQLRIAFYREGRIVQGFGVSDTYEVYNVQLEDSGKYSCEVRTTDGRVKKRSAERIIQIEEHFSKPNITMDDNVVTEGDAMTLTCDTTLSPYRPTTRLEFAFYRDGWKVQDSSPSNKYEVQSAQLEDSGNYTCHVKTSISSTMKISDGYNIWVQERNDSSLVTILSVSLGLLLLIIIVIIFIVLIICYRRRASKKDPEPTTGTENEESAEVQVTYTVLDMTSRPQNHLPKDNGPNSVYAVVNSEASQGTSDTSTSIYQNINSHR